MMVDELIKQSARKESGFIFMNLRGFISYFCSLSRMAYRYPLIRVTFALLGFCHRLFACIKVTRL